MSWYDSDFPYRRPISVDNTGAAGGTYDATIPIPADWDEFWTTAKAAGADLRVTSADGRTLVTFDADSFDLANRTGTIELDNVTLPANQIGTFWVYWGNSQATTALTSFAPSTPKSGYIALDAPPETWTIKPIRQRPDATIPRDSISKQSSEEVDVFLDIDDHLQKRAVTFENSLRHEEVSSVNLDVTTGGVSTATAFDETLVRVLEVDGRTHVRVRLKGGSSGTDYVVIVKVTTSLSRVHEFRFLMLVNDVDETA